MITVNRIKSSMMMAAVAAMMAFAVTGCTDEEPKTPAEELLSAAQNGNKRLDNLLSHHEVLTTGIVADLLAPIDRAGDKFNAEILQWQDEPPAAEVQGHEFEVYGKAGVEIANLTAKLDAQGFAIATTTTDTCTEGTTNSDDPDCQCDEVATTTDATGIALTAATADDPQGLEPLTETVYWKRIACKVACGTAQVLCVAACGPIIVGGVTVPAAVACAAACVLAGELCKDACGRQFPNCR